MAAHGPIAPAPPRRTGLVPFVEFKGKWFDGNGFLNFKANLFSSSPWAMEKPNF
jgi:hypothetical protein